MTLYRYQNLLGGDKHMMKTIYHNGCLDTTDVQLEITQVSQYCRIRVSSGVNKQHYWEIYSGC